MSELIKPKKPVIVFPKGIDPKYPLKIKLSLEFDLWSAPGATQGSAVFTFQDTTCDVSEGDKDLGSICGGMGGHFILRDSVRHLDYVSRPDTTWRLYQAWLKEFEHVAKITPPAP